MNDAEPSAWEWMFHGRYLGFTITFTHAVTPEECLRRYGVDPAAARHLPFVGIDAALQPGPDDAILRVGTLREWVFAIEILGGMGNAPSMLAEISRDTETIAIHVGASALHTVTYWVNGQPLEKFEPGEAPTLRAAGAHPFWDATERYRTAQPETRAVLAAMQAVEERVGGHLTPDLDDGPLLSVVLPQILPPPPSPMPALPRVNPSPPERLGRHLGSFRPPER
ncbi:DUF6461 domain-containing protein [Streptomyces olivaceoviridis]|uniref:DUF6461 domain-containing protein n=1 Tax=Streptomyces olivaceoviridis TaxID=1921 RepID=UPI0036C2A4EE